MKSKILGLLAVGLLAGPTAAHAAVIDFSLLPSGSLASYTEQGVTFTAFGGGQVSGDFGNTPNGTRGILAVPTPFFLDLRADIAGGASFVSVDLGDYNADADTLFLEIFNSSNVSLGFTSQFIDASFTGMRTLSLAAPNIAYAIFGARSPAVDGSSVYADNFTFISRVVPEPGTLALLGLGLAGLGLSRRRKAN